jgi:hypothetical protein
MTTDDVVVDVSQDWVLACDVQRRFMHGQGRTSDSVDYSTCCRHVRALGGDCYDFTSPSTRLNGKRPRVANMLVEDYLRPAAVKVGVLKEGEKVRFRYRTLRHSLASFLVRKGTDVKTVQRLLRHSDVSTTLAIYAHSMSEDRLAAQGDMLKATMKPPSDAVNWAATGESGDMSRTALFDRRLPQRLPNIYANLLNGVVPIA